MSADCTYPSVTQILRIMRYYDDMDLAGAANSIVGKERGSALHKAAHYLALGQAPPWKNPHPELDCFLNGVRGCLNDHRIELIEHEAAWVNHTERVTSHPDWHVIIDDCEAVVEIKTGALPKSVGLQTGGQVIARGKGIADIKRFALHLPGQDNYKLIPLTNYRNFAKFRLYLQTTWAISEDLGMFWLKEAA